MTVAVLGGEPGTGCEIQERDLEWEYFCSGGPGGQHQNKTASGCRVRHIPTGTVAECRSERSQHQNRREALALLRRKVEGAASARAKAAVDQNRKGQVGSGERGDKIRTYREFDDLVLDDRTGRKGRLSRLRRGDWSEIKK